MIPVTAAVWAPDGPCIWHAAERFVPDAHVRRAEPVPGGSAYYRRDGALGRGVQPMPSRTVPPSVPSRNNDRDGRGNDELRVAEQPEHVGAVDEVAAVVSVAGRHVAPVGDGQALAGVGGGHAPAPAAAGPGMRACT